MKVLAKSFEATCSHAAGAWWIPDPSSPASRFAQASESGARYVRWAKETWKEMQDVEHCRMVPGEDEFTVSSNLVRLSRHVRKVRGCG